MMMKLGKKIVSTLGTLCLAVMLMFSNNVSAANVIAFEPDSLDNPNILNLGDWSYATLYPLDKDYFKFTNPTLSTRTITLTFRSPSGANYVPLISGNGILGITPVVVQNGYYQFDFVCAPGAELMITVTGEYTQYYIGNPYFIQIS
ncbi:hypothetical protein [Paenibacillus xylaniclasticus]|uniref:hypothetical protein n=1 Tax=Paenibacillus xylaniclasticus TaxID=588083 RepID=UPI000FD72517|nr:MULTISPECIES: hypothetical protein [Paenibacillus]GFN33965.1 hypothetical protein PCURB6_42250 [Paenibacillus curdlanolyticus]